MTKSLSAITALALAIGISAATAQTTSEKPAIRPVYGAIDAATLAQLRFASRSLLAAKATGESDPDAKLLEQEIQELRDSLKSTLKKDRGGALLATRGSSSGPADDHTDTEDLRQTVSNFRKRRLDLYKKQPKLLNAGDLHESHKSRLFKNAEAIEDSVSEALSLPVEKRNVRLKELIEELQPRSQAELIYKQRSEMAKQYPDQAAFWLSEKASPTITFAVINEKK